MNNRQIATDVFKHPLIQEIIKRKLAESSIVNRLIVEEVLSENEETSPVDKLKNAATEALRENPDLAYPAWARSLGETYGGLEPAEKGLVNKHFVKMKQQIKEPTAADKQSVQVDDACQHFEKIWAEIKQNPEYEEIKNKAIKGTNIDPDQLENVIRSYSQNVSLALDLAALGAIALVFIVGSTTIGGFAMAPIIAGLLTTAAVGSLIACIIGVKQKDVSAETGGDCIASIPVLGRIAKFFGYGAKAAKLAKGAAAATKAAEKTADAGGIVGRLNKMKAGAEAAVKAADDAFLAKMTKLGMAPDRAAALLTITKRLTKEATKKAASEAKESFMIDGKLDEAAYNAYKKKLEECKNNASIGNSADIVSNEVEEFKKEAEEISETEVDKKELAANLQKATTDAEGEEEQGFFSSILSKITGGDDKTDKEDETGSETQEDEVFVQSLEDDEEKEAFREFLKLLRSNNIITEMKDIGTQILNSFPEGARDKVSKAINELTAEQYKLVIKVLTDEGKRKQFMDTYFSPRPPEKQPSPEQDKPQETQQLISDEQMKAFEFALKFFEGWFLRVPFLKNQQKILIMLMKSLDFFGDELKSIKRKDRETSKLPDDKEKQITTENRSDRSRDRQKQLDKVLLDLRYIDDTVRTLRQALVSFLDGGLSTKVGASDIKQDIVEGVKRLQKFILRTYQDLDKIDSPTLQEDFSEDNEAIKAVEQAYVDVLSAAPQFRTMIERSKNEEDVTKATKIITDILDSIAQYYPATAKFTPKAQMSSSAALKEFANILTDFHRDLIQSYKSLKDGLYDDKDVDLTKGSLLRLAGNLQRLLGVGVDIDITVDNNVDDAITSQQVVDSDEIPEDISNTLEEPLETTSNLSTQTSGTQTPDDADEDNRFSVDNMSTRIQHVKEYLEVGVQKTEATTRQQVNVIVDALGIFTEDPAWKWEFSLMNSDDDQTYRIESLEKSEEIGAELKVVYEKDEFDSQTAFLEPIDILKRFYFRMDPTEKNRGALVPLEDWEESPEDLEEQLVEKLIPIIKNIIRGNDG